MNVTIRVFGSRTYDQCFSGGWGPSQSQEEITLVLRDILRQHYGDQVDAKYIDIQEPAIHDYPQITEMVQNNEIYLPVVMLDEVIIGTGYISYPRILKELSDRGIKAVS